MVVKGERKSTDTEEVLILGVLWNDAVFVMKLHILESELKDEPV